MLIEWVHIPNDSEPISPMNSFLYNSHIINILIVYMRNFMLFNYLKV